MTRTSRFILLALSAIILLVAVTVFLTARWVTSQYAEDKAQEIPSHLLNFPGEQITLPLQMKNGWPIVEVMVNEQGPFSLILDTACTRLKLSGEVVDQLRLPEIGTSTSHNSAGQSIDSKTYGVETVALGTASFRKIAVSRDDNFLQGYPDIDGIFGQRHFGKLVMTMDFEGGTLKLRKGPTQKNDSSERLPITSKHSNPVLSLKIGEREIPFLIDTGMLGSLQVRESEVPTLPLHANRYLALQPSAGGLTLWQESTRLNHDLFFGKTENRTTLPLLVCG